MEQQEKVEKRILRVGSPNQVAEALQQEGFSVSAFTIRNWAKTGTIPFIKTGTKMLINKEIVQAMLETGGTTIGDDEAVENIRSELLDAI